MPEGRPAADYRNCKNVAVKTFSGTLRRNSEYLAYDVAQYARELTTMSIMLSSNIQMMLFSCMVTVICVLQEKTMKSISRHYFFIFSSAEDSLELRTTAKK